MGKEINIFHIAPLSDLIIRGNIRRRKTNASHKWKIDGWLEKTPYFASERAASEAMHAANALKIASYIFNQ